MAVAIVGLLLFGTVGTNTTFFPTIFFASFAIGLGIGTAFVPLITLAMADVPSEDAGLGSGITNVSQQIGGALGLAVLSTVAANRTKALLSAHHGVATSLIGGYHLAFLVGAAAIAIGIVLAFVLLRPSRAGLDPRLAEAPTEDDAAPVPAA
jgi:MFS family permease